MPPPHSFLYTVGSYNSVSIDRPHPIPKLHYFIIIIIIINIIMMMKNKNGLLFFTLFVCITTVLILVPPPVGGEPVSSALFGYAYCIKEKCVGVSGSGRKIKHWMVTTEEMFTRNDDYGSSDPSPTSELPTNKPVQYRIHTHPPGAPRKP
eukprot:Gb_15333 [translate_table: standard]